MEKKDLFKTIGRFAVALGVIVALQLVGAGISVMIGLPAQWWLEYFARSGYEDVAMIGVLVICVIGFAAVLVGISNLDAWLRMRKIRRLQP